MDNNDIKRKVKKFSNDTSKLLFMYGIVYIGIVLLFIIFNKTYKTPMMFIITLGFVFLISSEFKKFMTVIFLNVDSKMKKIKKENIELISVGIDRGMNYKYKSKDKDYVGDIKYILKGKTNEGKTINFRFSADIGEFKFNDKEDYKYLTVTYLEKSKFILNIILNKEYRSSSLKITKDIKKLIRDVNEF